jgi:hypothetical protein
MEACVGPERRASSIPVLCEICCLQGAGHPVLVSTAWVSSSSATAAPSTPMWALTFRIVVRILGAASHAWPQRLPRIPRGAGRGAGGVGQFVTISIQHLVAITASLFGSYTALRACSRHEQECQGSRLSCTINIQSRLLGVGCATWPACKGNRFVENRVCTQVIDVPSL